MAPRLLKSAVTVATAAALSLSAVPARADTDASVWTDLVATYDATARYAYEGLAKDGGFVPLGGCYATATGGVGYHYVNKANVGSLDPARPAALVYADEADDGLMDTDGPAGRRTLVAVEWIVKDKGQAAPTLFGQTFGTNPRSQQFTLRAWLYRPNGDGLFASYNPDVTCPAH
ncbi:hypothetical protein [Streptomyces panaciradicis]|uniref:hypothetical protein n=1 Tax=Streptomyces panaciradicis TaxID=1470261 RepID=UPI00201CFACA|nr:hypothetical protein [Streptomyces panaciradicis]MCL6667749.1 hypothetical protein [Streptomyces panaciradicis]